MKTSIATLALILGTAGVALAGPPWLSVEVRPAGMPFLIVRTYHHGTANPMPLRGVAEGLVDGSRVSHPLSIDPIADGNNAYGISRTWPDNGVWVLSITTEGDAHGGASAVVTVDRNGTASVRYPRRFDGQTRAATAAEITTMLTALADGGSPKLARTGWLGLASRAALPVLLLGLLGYFAVRLIGAGVGRLRAPRTA